MFERIKRYRRYRQTFNELMELSNRELNDLGISRGQIKDIAKGSEGIGG